MDRGPQNFSSWATFGPRSTGCTPTVANKLAMFFSISNAIQWRIKELSVDILKQTIAVAKRSGSLISEVGKTADLGNDAQFMVFVRYRATEDYVEQFLYCCQLAKHTTRKEMFKKVDSFTTKHQLSRTRNACVCADGAY